MTKATQFPHVLKFLQSTHVGVLSTINDEGDPWGSAIYYVVDEDFKIYFVTRAGTHKFQNLDNKPQVALTVVDASSQQTVQLAGTISRVPAHDYTDIVFTKLADIRKKHNADWSPPIEKIHKGDYMPLCITPNKLHYADFKKAYTEYDQKFIEEII